MFEFLEIGTIIIFEFIYLLKFLATCLITNSHLDKVYPIPIAVNHGIFLFNLIFIIVALSFFTCFMCQCNQKCMKIINRKLFNKKRTIIQ